MKEQEELLTLRDAADLDKAIITCAELLLDATDADTAIGKLLETVADYYGASRGYIFEIDQKSQQISNTYEFCQENTLAKIQDLQNLPVETFSHWLKALETDRCISINRLTHHIESISTEGKLLDSLGLDAVLIVPLQKKRVTYGFIGVDQPTRRADNPTLMTNVSAFVMSDLEKRASAMELCDAVSDMQKSLDMSQMMFQCANTLLGDSDGALGVSHLLELISNYLGADSAYVFEYNKKERVLKNSYSYHHSASQVPSDKTQVTPNILSQVHLSPMLASTADRFFARKFLQLRSSTQIEDTSSWEYHLPKVLSAENCIIAPFHKMGHNQGFLGIVSPRTNMEHREVITTVSAFIVNTVEKRGMINKLEYLSFSDELTGLKNRNAYLNKIKDLKRKNLSNFAVIFADLNDLKTVNEFLGHEVGDQLILWAVRFLQGFVRDPIYRIGGDEFVCFMSGITKERFEERVTALQNAQSRIGFKNLSFGFVWTEKVTDIDDQIFEADKMMFADKEALHREFRNNPITEEQKREKVTNRMKVINRNQND